MTRALGKFYPLRGNVFVKQSPFRESYQVPEEISRKNTRLEQGVNKGSTNPLRGLEG